MRYHGEWIGGPKWERDQERLGRADGGDFGWALGEPAWGIRGLATVAAERERERAPARETLWTIGVEESPERYPHRTGK